MTTITVKRTDQADLRFDGELIASADTKDSDNTRWQELELYETSTSIWVAAIINVTLWIGEKNTYRAMVCYNRSEIIDYFGYGDAAKRLYKEAEIDAAEIIE